VVTPVDTESKGNKPVSIILIVLGGLGILVGIISIIYSATGLSIALEGTGVEALQDQCRATFEDNGGDSGRCDDSFDWEDEDQANDVTMCGLQQNLLGCSYKHYKTLFEVSQAVGLGSTIAGSFFVIVASIPVLTNGIYGLLNKEVAARVSGGFGVGCSIPGVLGAGICTIVLLVGTAVVNAIDHVVSSAYTTTTTTTAPFGITIQPTVAGGPFCTPECQDALDGTKDLGQHLTGYYGTLTLFMLIMVILVFVESIFACISCCFWKRKAAVIVVQAPVVATAPVIAAPVVAPKVEGN